MSIKPAKVQFNGGELSPWLEGRIDVDSYNKTVKLCRNFIPMTEGSLRRRGGTHFVAETPQGDEVRLHILTVPYNAVVFINGVEQNEIYVARGDKVSYEVRADGYVTKRGEIMLVKDTDIRVTLISTDVVYRLTIHPQPEDAIVKINGVVGNSAQFFENETVSYVVYKDGYELRSDSLCMTEDMDIEVVLSEAQEEAVTYGDWGTLNEFVCCSMVGSQTDFLKCFCLRFSTGYLIITFSPSKLAPSASDWDEGKFFVSLYDKYNSAAYDKSGRFYITRLSVSASQAYVWKDYTGKVIWTNDQLTRAMLGWPVDEFGQYASIFRTYSGVINNGVLNVYCGGNLVWTLKGRK